MKPTYALICFYEGDKILLQNRRSINNWNSEWGMFGGHIEEGETDHQAIIRETKEELDIDLKEKDVIYLGTVRAPIGGVYSSVYISPLAVKLEDIKVLEGDGCELFSEAQVDRLLLHPGDIYRIKMVFNYLNLTKLNK